MTKYIFYCIIAMALLGQLSCSQNSDGIGACYTDKLPGNDEVLTTMSEKPHFQGGNDSLVDYLNANINFEKLIDNLSQSNQVYGDTARIKFIVSKDGGLSDLSVTLAKKKIFEGEVERVIKKSSCNWVAGKTEQPVTGWVQFDIYFMVEKSNKEVKTTMTFNEYTPVK